MTSISILKASEEIKVKAITWKFKQQKQPEQSKTSVKSRAEHFISGHVGNRREHLSLSFISSLFKYNLNCKFIIYVCWFNLLYSQDPQTWQHLSNTLSFKFLIWRSCLLQPNFYSFLIKHLPGPDLSDWEFEKKTWIKWRDTTIKLMHNDFYNFHCKLNWSLVSCKM